MNRVINLAFALTVLASAAQACPERLARMGGVSVYQGSVAMNVELAPDRQARDMRGRNVWTNLDPYTVTIVCHSERGQDSIMHMEFGQHRCTQDLAAQTFTCGH